MKVQRSFSVRVHEYAQNHTMRAWAGKYLLAPTLSIAATVTHFLFSYSLLKSDAILYAVGGAAAGISLSLIGTGLSKLGKK